MDILLVTGVDIFFTYNALFILHNSILQILKEGIHVRYEVLFLPYVVLV